jgi:DNA polymerase
MKLSESDAKLQRIIQSDSLNKCSMDIYACEKCGICKETKKKVTYVGANTPMLLFIGEAPSARDALNGDLFSGLSGTVLRNEIKANELSDVAYAITDAVKCRPSMIEEKVDANTNDRRWISKSRQPDTAEVANCMPFLIRQLYLFRPRVVVSLGWTAMKAIDKAEDKLDVRKIGFERRHIVHPASTLHEPEFRQRFADEFHSLAQRIIEISADLKPVWRW